MSNYQVISYEAYANKRWQHNNSYQFAASEALVPVLAAELVKASMSLPLAFIQQGTGYQPVALMGLTHGQNLFIAKDGGWMGGYVPAFLRSYPFRLTSTADGQQVLCIDSEYNLLADGDGLAGDAFFNADGAPSMAIKHVLDFLSQQEGNQNITAAACAKLQELQLIVPWNITVQRGSGEQKVEGLYKVDEAALNALADEYFVTLRQNGALLMAYCQLLSMQHLSILGQLARARTTPDVQMTNPISPTNNLDLSLLGQGGTIHFGGLV